MIFGVYYLMLFSVSATLKVCIIIIPRKNLKSRGLFKFIFTKLNNVSNRLNKGNWLRKNKKGNKYNYYPFC